MSKSVPPVAAASTVPATAATTVAVSTTGTTTVTRMAAATAKDVVTAATANSTVATAPRVPRAVFHQLCPNATPIATAATSAPGAVATASEIPTCESAKSATPPSTARVATSSASVRSTTTVSTASTVPSATPATPSATATASSTQRDLSPYRYQTSFKHVLFGRRARQVVMNVYSRLRIECPHASYNDIVKQTTHLTGVSHSTIFSWKKIVDPIDDDMKSPPKMRRRRKNASSSPLKGSKIGTKESREKELGAEQQAVPKKVRRRKALSLDGTEAYQVAVPPAKSAKVQQNKPAASNNEGSQVATRSARATKTELKKVNPVERPSSQETTQFVQHSYRRLDQTTYQTDRGTAISSEPWKSRIMRRANMEQADQLAMTYAKPRSSQSNQVIHYEQPNQASTQTCKQGERGPFGQSVRCEQPTNQANVLAAVSVRDPCNEPLHCEQQTNPVGTHAGPKAPNQCQVWWTTK
ncbi:cell wall protein DAN4 [Ixodes scapularis]